MSRSWGELLARSLVALLSFFLAGAPVGRAHAGWRSGSPLSEPRQRHTATLLPDGRVLIVGGSSDAGCLDTAEIWEPRGERSRPTRSLSQERCFHSAALLKDGRVLVAGGESARAVEVFDPITETWRAAGSLQKERLHPSVFQEADGRVLIFGGETAGDSLSVAEVWDPRSGRLIGSQDLPSQRRDHAGVQLADGRILVIGAEADSAGGRIAEALDPTGAAWSQLASLDGDRTRPTLTRLLDGRAAAFGGSDEPSAEVFDPRTGQWSRTRPARSGRHDHTATLLRDGTLLVVGGYAKRALSAAESFFHQLSLGRVERWSPISGRWTLEPPLARARSLHTATLLPDGRVLVAGGAHKKSPGGSLTLSSTELFGEPAAPRPVAGPQPAPPPADAVPPGRWIALKPLLQARQEHSATQLPDGHVLLVGGWHSEPNCSLAEDTCGHSHTTAAPELWDPQTGTSRVVGDLLAALEHSATLLRSGQVLIAGGYTGFSPRPYTSDVSRFDAATGKWQVLPRLQLGRSAHRATLLQDGRVLLTGGESDKGREASTELWEPENGTTRLAASMGQARSRHTATLLPDGRVLVIGGETGKARLASTEIYDPRRSLWQPGPPLLRPRASHSTLVLGDGSVLVIGGDKPEPTAQDPAPMSTAELLLPGAQRWAAAGTLASKREGHSALLLPDGQVVVAGGAGDMSSRVEVWEPRGRRFRRVAHALFASSGHAAVLLADGRAILFGGEGAGARVQAGLSLGAPDPGR